MKGDTAVLDLYTHFVRKDDMSDEDMMKREKQKKADIQAAMGLLQNAGYGIFKLDAIKSEPADDGEGKDEGKNPADGSDAGGPRDDGTSGTPDSGKSMDGADADAGGPRDNGTDGAAVALTNDYVPINKAEKAAVKAALAAVRKSAADPDNDGDNDADPAGDTDGDAASVDPAKPAPMPAMKTGKTKKADPKMPKKPVACADESDMPNPNEMAGGDGPDGEGSDPDDESVQEITHQKSGKTKKTDAPVDIAALIRGEFAKAETNLKTVVDGLRGEVSALATRVEKSEAASANVTKRLSAIVPAQAPGEGSGAVRKSGNELPAPLDTGYATMRR
jgi:hypothetical protein